MPTFDEHINQAKYNLDFLESINTTQGNYWDWQVTVSFYVGVHLVNAHLIKSTKQQFRTHEEVNQYLNPKGSFACKLDDNTYIAYRKIRNLSRRSRYLIHDDPSNKDPKIHFTYDKHFAKAIKNLDILIEYFKKKYNLKFNTKKLKCLELNSTKGNPQTKLKNFEIID